MSGAAPPVFPAMQPAVALSERSLCALAIDAEEDFDWDRPLASTDYSTQCMHHVGALQEIAAAWGIVPSYLLTYPVLQDEAAVHILRRLRNRGACDLGLQLHPWVTPPFVESEGVDASFSANLPADLEERKLLTLRRLFIERFGEAPRLFRAGRYGLGARTTRLLETYGFTVDTSLAPRTTAADEGGPDHAHYDYAPFWFGRERPVLEVPLCRSVVGLAGRFAPAVHDGLRHPALRSLHLGGLATRLRLAERVTLSPEGNDVRAMQRLLRHLRGRGTRIFVLSFHSSSLAAGRNPYVRTRADLHHFYERLSAIIAVMARLDFTFVRLADLPGHLRAPAG